MADIEKIRDALVSGIFAKPGEEKSTASIPAK